MRLMHRQKERGMASEGDRDREMFHTERVKGGRESHRVQ